MAAAAAARERESAAEAVGQLAAELELEAVACGAPVAIGEPPEGGTVLEEALRSTVRVAPERGCGGHVPVIGALPRPDDPWRE